MSGQELFLGSVVPWTAGHFINVHGFQLGEKGKLDPKGSRAARSLTEATSFANWCNNMGWEVYFCVSSQRNSGVGKPDKRGGTYYRALRGIENAANLKAFHVDIDVKPGPDHHNTLEAAAEALQRFCEVTGLPLPTFAIYSGGGLHVYWVLSAPMPYAEWRPLAGKLADACRQHGVLADHNVTVNGAAILRVPGTFNRKYTPHREVTYEVLGGSVPRETIERALAPYSDNNPGSGSPSGGSNDSTDLTKFPVIGPPVAMGKFTDGIFEENIFTLDDLAHDQACPFVKKTLETGGKDHKEPLWFQAGHIAVFTAGSLDDYRKLSHGHARFSEADLEAKFRHILESKHTKDLGWPTCAAIQNAGATQCASCPHLKEGKSPFHFAARSQPEPKVTTGGNSGDYVHKREVVLVKGYIPGLDARYFKPGKGKDDPPQPVWDYPMWNLERKEERGVYSMHFDTENEYNSWVHVAVPINIIGPGEGLRNCLSRFGLGIRSNQQVRFGDFMNDFMSQMAAAKQRSGIQETMGWANGPNGQPVAFIYGDMRYNCNGNAPFFQNDRMVRELYSTIGSIDAYRAAIKMVNDEKRPEVDLLVATAFAAPLMRFTSHDAVVVLAYSPASAVHKSTCLKVGQSVWGAMRAINQLTDTENAIVARADKAKVLPVYFDEMKASTDVAKFQSIVYVFSGGRGKARLGRNAEIRDVDKWETMLVGASNDSLVSYIATKDKTTEAGINRIFEFEMGAPTPGVGQLTMGGAAKIIEALKTNYGHAGKIYAEYLGQSVEQLPGIVKEFMDTLQRKLGAKDDERFWVAAAACLLIGATLANNLNLARFDIGRMSDFIARTFVRMRGVRAFGDLDISKEANLVTALQSYMNIHRRTWLVTDMMGAARGRPGLNAPQILNLSEINLAQQLAIHEAKNQKLLRISKRHLADYLTKERGASPAQFIENIQKHLQGKIIHSRIGSGIAVVQTSKEALIELDLNHPLLVDLVDG